MKTASYRQPSPETAPTDSVAAGRYTIRTLGKHVAKGAEGNILDILETDR